jgi:hypothetical protein
LEDNQKKMKKIEENLTVTIDYDFTEVDAARASAKLTDAAERYDRNSMTAKSLDAFSCDSLSPGR